MAEEGVDTGRGQDVGKSDDPLTGSEDLEDRGEEVWDGGTEVIDGIEDVDEVVRRWAVGRAEHLLRFVMDIFVVCVFMCDRRLLTKIPPHGVQRVV